MTAGDWCTLDEKQPGIVPQRFVDMMRCNLYFERHASRKEGPRARKWAAETVTLDPG